MSILGLICVLLALVATLLFVLFLFQRRDLRAVTQLSLNVQRALSGERLPLRMDVDPQYESQADLQALVGAVNQLLLRAVRTAGREKAGPKLFTELGERIHEAVLVHRDVILYANSQFASFVGVDRVDLIDRKLSDLVAPEYADLVSDNLRRRLAGMHGAERFEVEMVGLQGQVSLLELTNAVIEFEGAPALLVTGVEVIPTRKLRAIASGRINEKEAAARAALVAPPLPPPPPPVQVFALHSLAEAIVTTDVDGRLGYLNPAAEKLLGVPHAGAAGKRLEEIVDLVDQNDRKLVADPVKEAVGGGNGNPHMLTRRAVLLGRNTGQERAIEIAASPLRVEDRLAGAVVLLHDVTELRGLHRQMSYQATHDALTGLVNRREFERRLEEAAEAARRGEAAHMLCFLDLDRFKIVNDSGGHLAGDSMLRELAKLLRDAVRDSDTVARLGGDEFAMLLVGCPLDKARQIADDVCRSVAAYRFTWHDRVFNIGVSIGLIEIGRESGPVEQLLASADSACYVAKKEGAGRVVVYSARDEAVGGTSGEIEWLQKLQGAIKEERFALYYQPIVSAIENADEAEGEGPSVEVLLRMLDESGKEIPPGDFVHAAERFRLMASVDRWVVQTTLRALANNAFHLGRDRSVAINISGQTLGDPQFLEFVVECLDNTGVSSAQVCFEIAESAVIGNLEHARRFVGVLHGMGCKFTIDDFGSGVGSFSSLKSLELDYLKLDGSFMRNLARDSVSQTMVTAMIKLARTLNFKIIAEQVEDSAALDAARKMGVDYVQGFVIARPARLATAA
jgi:diguanylate cyclase (GGDEF)-like protein/PAS domain S-box-containing protein